MYKAAPFIVIALIYLALFKAQEWRMKNEPEVYLSPVELAAQYEAEKVDLGLSVYWASHDIGVTDKRDFGYKYVWGDIEPRKNYEPDSCKTNGNDSIRDIAGNVNYDAARYTWKGKWRLPTKDEVWELLEKCDVSWTEENGIRGHTVRAPNKNTIFFRIERAKRDPSKYKDNVIVYFATSQPDTTNSTACYSLCADRDGMYIGRTERWTSLRVRPVYPKD